MAVQTLKTWHHGFLGLYSCSWHRGAQRRLAESNSLSGEKNVACCPRLLSIEVHRKVLPVGGRYVVGLASFATGGLACLVRKTAGKEVLHFDSVLKCFHLIREKFLGRELVA